MAAAAIGQQLFQVARDKRLLSQGLNHLSRRSKNKALSKLFGIGGGIAGALGFANPVQGGPRRPRPQVPRRGRRRITNAMAQANGGSSTAGAANAPVAFARTDRLRAKMQFGPGDTDDAILVHACEQVQAVGYNPAFNPNFDVSQPVSPTNATLFPWLSVIAAQWERYKLKKLRLHYQHYAPTNVQAEIMTQYFPNPDKDPTTLTAQELKECSNFMTGACYEDFVQEVDLSAIDPSEWYDTGAAVSDSTNEYCGRVGVYGMNGVGAAGAVNTGNFWIEAVFELKGRQTSALAAAMADFRKALRSKADPARRLAVMAAICQKLIQKADDARVVKPRQDPFLALEEDLQVRPIPVSTLGLKFQTK